MLFCIIYGSNDLKPGLLAVFQYPDTLHAKHTIKGSCLSSDNYTDQLGPSIHPVFFCQMLLCNETEFLEDVQ